MAIPFVDVHPQTIAATLAVRSIPEAETQAVVVILVAEPICSAYKTQTWLPFSKRLVGIVMQSGAPKHLDEPRCQQFVPPSMTSRRVVAVAAPGAMEFKSADVSTQVGQYDVPPELGGASP